VVRQVDFLIMELSSLASVREFASQYSAREHPLHLLVNNAGIMATPFAKTGDGFEAQFQVGTAASQAAFTVEICYPGTTNVYKTKSVGCQNSDTGL
jgi:NAD(P)-dependent dehydrogenase (short-subunit alcohol dehydrogenase family)